MKKNVSGQFVGASLVNTAGASVTTGTTNVFITIDNGTQATASVTASHKGNGYWSLAATQAETNGDHVAFTFSNSGAVAGPTIQVFPGDVTPSLVFSGNPTTAAGLTVTLPTTSTTNSQVGNLLGVASGPGYGQWRPITGWTTTTTSRTITIASAWETVPTTASTLVIAGFGITPINGDSAGNAVVGSFSDTASAQIRGQMTASLGTDVYELPTAGLSTSNTIVQYLRLTTHMAMAGRSSSTSTETVMNFTGSAALFTASVTYTTASATATRALFA